ncbi:hypothetical protein [Leptolyngbya sp. GGD]|uniref:hypothetical protein n=1 Tax=Leptolyngbya sp. GGD TaxID=2997907 RepID=UPI00227AB907|nr:hypothetical protein [Leptolyngbya sp. GGD]MCY6492125.1 hypothetical protein [Leptolyngbya sp. GGD]
MEFQEVVKATQQSRTFKIKQPRFWVLCHLYLPDEVAEHLSAIEVSKVRGQYLLGFNFKPEKGEYFPYCGHIWRVKNNPIQFPARYKTKGRKEPPFVMAEYVTTCDSEAEIFTAMLDLSINS